MSFDWNLSDEDEEDLEEWTKRNNPQNTNPQVPHLSSTRSIGNGSGYDAEEEPTIPFAAAPQVEVNDFDKENEEEESEEDEENVDWEDAGEESDHEEDRKPPATTRKEPAKAVTIDFNSREPAGNSKINTKKRKFKQRKTFRLQSLPNNMQSLLIHLHQSHLLSLTSRLVHLSQLCCVNQELLAVAHSLVPVEWMNVELPSCQELRRFLMWYVDLVRHIDTRRQAQQRANRAAGAPRYRRPRSATKEATGTSPLQASATTIGDRVVAFASYLSPTWDGQPHVPMLTRSNFNQHLDPVLLLVAMTRSLGWRTRLVQRIDPISTDLTVDHPLLAQSRNVFQTKSTTKKTKKIRNGAAIVTDELDDAVLVDAMKEASWVEILCVETDTTKRRWIQADPVHDLVDRPDLIECLSSTGKVEKNKFAPLSYAVAVEHVSGEGYRLTDVTRRYSSSWSETLRLRGVRSKQGRAGDIEKDSWWSQTLKHLNNLTSCSFSQQETSSTQERSGVSTLEAIDLMLSDECKVADRNPCTSHFMPDDEHVDEESELRKSASDEKVPTSKAGFNRSGVYIIPSLLGKAEVIAPDAKKRICGVFKGELIYRRSDVSTARVERKWLYEGRKVRKEEIGKPIKRVKARKKPESTKGAFVPLKSYGIGEGNDGSEEQRERILNEASEAVDDGMENLYAIWQTEAWSPPPVGPSDPIPVNEYRNIELALLNPGLVHIDQRGVAMVAKTIGVPYAPCLLGFEGQGGNRTPNIRGIVVHQHNAPLIQDANVEATSYAIEKEEQARQQKIHRNWKRLMVALLTKERIEREYG